MYCKNCGQEMSDDASDDGCKESEWLIDWDWTPAKSFSAPIRSVVLRRHKSRESKRWVYSLYGNWDPVSFSRWGDQEDSEYLLIE
jgi:hypothetical protein